jgi:PKD repeat protein
MKKLVLVGLALIVILVVSAACSGASNEKTYTYAGPTTPASMDGMRHEMGLDKPALGQVFGNSGSSGGGAYTTTIAPQTTSAPRPSPTMSIPAATYSGVDNSSAGWEELSQEVQGINRMVIRNGNIQLVVSDVAAALDNITKLAGDNGGYVVTSQKWKDGERNMGTISIRVLAENYDKAVSSLRSLAMSVISETSTSQDVTEEYVDLDAKVKNLEATETQLLKVMEAAIKTEDVLAVQRELTNVRGEIEQAKGRMQYLQRTTSTSYIEIQLREAVLDIRFTADKVRANTDEAIVFTSEIVGGFTPYSYLWDFGNGDTSVEKSPRYSYTQSGTYQISLKVTDDKGYTNTLTRSEYITVIGSWSPGSIAASAWNGFTAFGRGLVNVLIYVGIFSPVWIIIGGIIGWTVYRRRKKAK